MNTVEKISQEQAKQDRHPDFAIGDTVKVHYKIKEGGKERIQVYTGTVIARKGGGVMESITVRRISYGEGVERVFLLNSRTSTRLKLTVTVRFAARSCTTCVIWPVRRPASKNAASNYRPRPFDARCPAL